MTKAKKLRKAEQGYKKALRLEKLLAEANRVWAEILPFYGNNNDYVQGHYFNFGHNPLVASRIVTGFRDYLARLKKQR